MNRLPPEGSLRQAVFLTVWLRRQEIEAHKAKLHMYAGMGDHKATVGAYREYVESLFPFAARTNDDMDDKLKKFMAKEVAKGAISFSTASLAPIKKVAATASLTDEFKQKLASARKNRKLA